MKRALPTLAVGVTLMFTQPGKAQDDVPQLDTLSAQISYIAGLSVANSFEPNGSLEFDAEAFMQAISDVQGNAAPRMSDEERRAAMGAFQKLVQEELAAQKLEDNAAFLERNGTRDGVTTTDSGLQYQVTEAGSGDSPTASDAVTVHYEGRLLDGSVFDSSIARGEPASFSVGGVIRGWQEALQLMAPGAKWEVWIPSKLAYGPQGAGRSIGPNEVLNFTIELISIDG